MFLFFSRVCCVGKKNLVTVGIRGNMASDRSMDSSSHCGVSYNVASLSFKTGWTAGCSMWYSLF